VWATWTHWTHAEFDPIERRRVWTAPSGDTWNDSRGRTNKVKVLLFNGPCVGSLNGGKQAWVGRARTADARFLRSIIDRCVSLLDLIAPPLAPLSLVFSHILCFKTPLSYAHILHTPSHQLTPRPRNNRPPWPLSSRPAPHFPIPSLHEELRTRTSSTALS